MKLAIIIYHSMWTINFGRLGSLDLVWECMAGPFREHSLQVAFEHVTSLCKTVLCVFIAQLPLWWFRRRGRISPDPCHNDKARVRLDRLVRLLRVWEIRKRDNRYCLFLIPCKIHRILHLIHRFIIQFHP